MNNFYNYSFLLLSASLFLFALPQLSLLQQFCNFLLSEHLQLIHFTIPYMVQLFLSRLQSLFDPFFNNFSMFDL